MRLFTLLSVAGIACATAAHAADKSENEAPTVVAEKSPFDLAFGVAFVSNYISQGSTLTQNKPAAQAYIEASYDMLYAGTWVSNIRAEDVSDAEIDLYAGIRPTFGALSLDLGYVQYYYPKNPNDYGELYAKANYALTDQFSAGAAYYHDVFVDTDWLDLTATLSELPWDTSVSGKVGTDFGSQSFDTDKVAWDLGVSRTFADVITVDVRYHDSNYDPGRVVAKLSFDTTWSALHGSQ